MQIRIQILEKMDPDPNLGKDIYFKFTDFLTEEDF